MRTVYKYPIEKIQDEFSIEMPEGAEILSLMVQGEIPCLWALVDDEAPHRERNFYLVGTGHPLPDHEIHPDNPPPVFIGSFQLTQFSTPLVFHVFEDRRA